MSIFWSFKSYVRGALIFFTNKSAGYIFCWFRMGAAESKQIFKDKLAELATQEGDTGLLNEILNIPATPEDFHHFVPIDTVDQLMKPWLVPIFNLR